MAHLALRSKSASLYLACTLLTAGCGKDDQDGEGANTAPVAEAGGPQLLTSNAPVNLSGSGSFDPDGDPITFHWTMDSAPADSALLDSESPFSANSDRDPTTTFTPDAEGTFVVSLVVVDGRGLFSTPDRTTITINSGSAPVADAGDDQSANVSETVALDGSESWDGLGRELNYDWSFAQVPSTSSLTDIDGSFSANASFVPDVSGLYLVALVVDNGLQPSSPDTIIVRVNAGESDAPIADAGTDVEGDDCTDIPVDGSNSYDPNSEPLTYAWDLEERPEGSAATTDSFANQYAEQTTFYPDVDGEYVLSLAVHDGVGWSTPDHIVLTANERSYNSPASINPGLSQEHAGGEAICESTGFSSYICAPCESMTIPLGSDATISDPDGDTVQFSWVSESGSASVPAPNRLSTSAIVAGARPSAPDACESTNYTFRLNAVDCTGQESSQTVTHSVSCCGYLAE